jgi:uroporphyrinogen-III decarboxylase
MDLGKLRDRFPRLTLMGNISSWTMSQGAPADVEAEVRSCMDAARERRGIIVGMSNYVQPETPPANIDALLEAVERYR